MWNAIKEAARKVGRALGLIKHINEISEHKDINVDEEEYRRIETNKDLYKGVEQELQYKNSVGKTIKRRRKSLNMPKVLAKKMARLAFNEGVEIGLTEVVEDVDEMTSAEISFEQPEHEKTEQFELIKDVFESNKFKREFQRYLEYMFAMGGVAVEVYMNGDEPKIQYVTADAFYPLSHDTETIDEAVIANVERKDEYIYTLLKWHEWGEWGEYDEKEEEHEFNYRIKNELYRTKEDKPDELGDKVSLDKLYDDMAEETFFYLRRPLFVYVKPNEANNKHVTSPLGISMFENAKDTIEMLDVMYDFWYNEFRLGRRRVAVPEAMVKTGYDAEGNPHLEFDDTEELYQALKSDDTEDFKIHDLTVDIRVDQITNSIQSLLDVLAVQVGLSAGTFTFKDGGVKTATQVVSENSETYQTRASHINIIEDALRDLVVTVYDVVTLDGTDEIPDEPLEREDISIDFNDGVFNDTKSQLDFYIKASNAGFIPDEVVLKRLFGLSDAEAKKWMLMISAKRQGDFKDQEKAIKEMELNVER